MPGSPAGLGRPATSRWRQRVADTVAGHGSAQTVRLDFTVEASRWVDLDTLVEGTLAGLRDAGACARGFSGLRTVLATRNDGPELGVAIRLGDDLRAPPPGPVALDAHAAVWPRPDRRSSKAAWRDRVAAAWAGRAVLTGPVWADLAVATAGSVVAVMEPTLDGLEPCLGRDPHGRPWQEFFPYDDRIRWLRLRRAGTGQPAVRLTLGPLEDTG